MVVLEQIKEIVKKKLITRGFIIIIIIDLKICHICCSIVISYIFIQVLYGRNLIFKSSMLEYSRE